MADLKEVARLAGVSIATVSRTLGRPELVREETRSRVMAAIKQTGYTPNVMGRNLRSLRTKTVVLLVPDISNPFFSEVIRGIEQVAQKQGYSVLLGDTQHDPERENIYANYLNSKQADGVLLLGNRLPGSILHLAGPDGIPSKPIVSVCEYSPEMHVPGVLINNESAAFDATAHLLELGHRRIGVITGPMESPLSQDRLRGARRAIEAHGVNLSQELRYFGDFSILAGSAGARYLLELPDPPTAIFCFNDEMALGVMQHARERGIEIPRQLSLVGFDDISFAQYFEPPLTTIRQPTAELGAAAMHVLLDLITGRPLESLTRILPTKLIVRESTASVS